MDRAQRTVDSLRLLQDWSKWLITLQTAVCMSLWPKLTGTPSPPALMYAGWMMFWASILVAADLLLSISIFVRRVDVSGERDIKIVWVLVAVQYACFLSGLFCFALNILLFWLGV
ncbi:MAG TPA: hypothetical protein VJT71_16490 [Pyrinomonadaceae bacterium]|nr:hypothetical protein [Pyrinomonadaceae bacterium]